jgi:hypothetical protein
MDSRTVLQALAYENYLTEYLDEYVEINKGS